MPHSLAAFGGRVYWALEYATDATSSGGVYSVSVNGVDTRTIANGRAQPRAVVSDSIGINWVEDTGRGGTQLVRWSETAGIQVRFSDARLLSYLAVDGDAVYAVSLATTPGAPATLEKRTGVTGASEIMDTWPGGGKVSVSATDVYWGYGRRVPKSGAPAHSLAGGGGPVAGMRYAAGSVYLAPCDYGAAEGDVLRVDESTEVVTKLTRLPGCAADFAYGNGTLYAVTGNADPQAPAGGLFAIDLATGEYRALLSNANDPIELAQDEEALYWGEFIPGGRIMKWVK